MNPSVVSIGGFIFVLFLSFSSHSAEVSSRANTIALDKVWLQLLHFSETDSKSRVTSKGFFMSAKGMNDPESELVTTIAEFKKPFQKDGSDKHAICRFPARYIWLKAQGLIDSDVDAAGDCPKFGKWARPKQLQSISLVHVTGYLGNPASTFGHVLLKIDNNQTISDSDLLNQSANYGAIVPDGENGFLYTLYGLFGGYKAGFTAKEVYKENHIYLDKELRDMWEYKLNLSDGQNLFLVSHLWELLGNQFDYYFIDENCAYKMGELVELVTQKEIVSEQKVWHIPSDIFHALKSHPGLVKSISFTPSLNRIVIGKYEALTDEGKSFFKRVVNGDKSIDGIAESNIHTLSVALADYYKYKMSDEPDSKYLHLKERNRWLLSGIRHPVQKNKKKGRYAQQPPTAGSRVSVFYTGIQLNSDASDYFEVGGAVSFHDAISLQKGKTKDTEFVAIDFSVLMNRDKIELNKFTFAKVSKYITSKSDILGEAKLSWSLDVGYMRDKPHRLVKGVYLKAGIGKSAYLGQSLTYTLAELTLQKKSAYKSYVGVDWRLGAVIPYSGNLNGIIEIRKPINLVVPEKARIEIRHGYNFTKDRQIRFEAFLAESNNELKLSFLNHW